MTSLGEQSLFSSNRRKKRFCQTNGILEKTDVLFKRKYGQDNRKHEVVKRMIQAATAPIVAGLFYLYIRDKYEKEPWRMLVWGILFGVYATFVIYGGGLWLERTFPHPETPLYTSFVSSALVEEAVKFLFVYALISRNPQFNGPFDGIVYAVFLSLGFAWIENMVYVTHPIWGGYGTALSRAVISVPGHGLFGVQMGYWLARWRFCRQSHARTFAFLLPYCYHSVFNFLLLQKMPGDLALFLGLQVWLWIDGLRKMRRLLELSPFRPKREKSSVKW